MDVVREKCTHVTRPKWKCPPKIVLSDNWHVAAGEESKEAKFQMYRETKVPEAFYPCLSHIPQSPSSPLRVQDHHLDESLIPVIPITPIEEDRPPQNSSLLPGGPGGDPHSDLKQPTKEKPALEVGPDAQADVALAASTVLTALLKSKESGSLIDTDMLVKILSEPKTIKKLIGELGTSDCGKTEPVLESKLSTSMPFSSLKDGMVEEMCNEQGTLSKSVSKSSPEPDTVFQKTCGESRVVDYVRNTSASCSGPVKYPSDFPISGSETVISSSSNKHELGAIFTVTVPLPRSNSPSSPVTSLSQPDEGVNKPIGLLSVPIGAPLSLLPKRMVNEYEIPARTGHEPFSRSTLLTSEVTVPSLNEHMFVPTRMNIYPSPRKEETGLKLKAVSSDALRPSLYASSNSMHLDCLPKSVSPDASRHYVRQLANQRGFEMKASSLNQAVPGLQMMAPLPCQVQPSSLTVAPSPTRNLVQHGSWMKPPSPCMEQPNLQTQAVQPTLETPTPNMVQHGSLMKPPFRHIEQPNLQTQAPFLSEVQSRLETSSSANIGCQLQDFNYAKSLIKQHGKMQRTWDHSFRFHPQDSKSVPNSYPNELATKIHRPCYLFNSPEGCKFGSTCPYLHDTPQNLQRGSFEGQLSTKRMRVGEDISAIYR